jgi:hypothetical protein
MKVTRSALTLAAAIAAGLAGGGSFAWFQFGRELQPLEIANEISVALHAPGPWASLIVGEETVGSLKAYTNAAGDSMLAGWWKKRTLTLGPWPTHALRVSSDDAPGVVDEWLTRNPSFPEVWARGREIGLYRPEGSTAVLYGRISIFDSCAVAPAGAIEGEYQGELFEGGQQ